MDELSKSWDGKHAGVRQHHRVAVLSGDVKLTPIGFSADDG